MSSINNTIHLSLRNIELYGRDTKTVTPIISKISAGVRRGSVIAIIGPSGGGKSSLLRIMNGLMEPDGGDLFLSGIPYRDIPPRTLRRRVGMVFQEPSLFPGTVEYNLRFPFRVVGRCPSGWEQSAHSWLEQVNLNPNTVWDREIEDFSLGEKQRIALVRTLLTEPEVLLLDEPTASLDPGNTSFIVDTICRLHQETKLTVVWVTHTLDVARRVADRVWVIRKGVLLEEGDVNTIFEAPTHAETQRFINGDAV
jgi:putative ABC transport system ATP-binding protein